MADRDHDVRFASREKDVTTELLDAYRIPHVTLGRSGRGLLGLTAEGLTRTVRLAELAGRWRPDVITGCMGPAVTLAGRLRGIPTVVLYNNETATLANRIAQPLASAYVTSSSWRGRVRGPHVAHPSYHELAYLHPDRFVPDPGVLTEVGLSSEERPIVIRFPALTSSHDRGVLGIGDRETLLGQLERLGPVRVSAESPTARASGPRRLSLPAHRFHDLLACALLQIGESATVAAEAAVLGVPSLYVASSPRGYLQELEESYDLVRCLASPDEALTVAERILADPDDAIRRRARRDRMLAEREDLTRWLVDYFEREGWMRGRRIA